jgi:hypothetical protein
MGAGNGRRGFDPSCVTCKAQHLVRRKLTAPMTAISLAQAARLGNLGSSAVTAGIKVDRSSRDNSSREHFGPHDVISGSQESAGGFVDFLLGRGARHPR